jgi:hypothetical protein
MICPQPLTLSKPILFADDTNIIISHPEFDCFQICMNDVFAGLNKWIKANKLTLNFVLPTKIVNLSTEYVDKTTEEVETTKFLGLQVDNNLKFIYIL